MYENKILDCVVNYKYLGLYFSTSGSFSFAQNELYKIALKAYYKLHKDLLYPRSPKGERGILFYLCPSKIFFVAFFSVTVDGRNLIFGHKHHIGMPYCG